MDEIYTLQETADKLKISIRTVTREVKSGRLKSMLVGRQYRISETFLMEYVTGIFGNVPVTQTRKINPSETEKRQARASKKSGKVSPVDEASQQVDESEPEIVSKLETMQVAILRLQADGLKHSKIAEVLNALGYQTPRGRSWQTSNVQKYLQELNKKSLSVVDKD